MKLGSLLGPPQALGEAALCWPLPEGIDRQALRAGLAPLRGVEEVVFSESWVMLRFDPRLEPPGWEEAELGAAGGAITRREHRISVCYDGPDLARMAAATGMAIEEVVARHHAPVYTVLYLGFLPGFAYLGDVDPKIRVPRLASPRSRVPAGAVALADARSGLYPQASPGGWNLLGHAPHFQAVDPDTGPVLQVGDRVIFRPL